MWGRRGPRFLRPTCSATKWHNISYSKFLAAIFTLRTIASAGCGGMFWIMQRKGFPSTSCGCKSADEARLVARSKVCRKGAWRHRWVYPRQPSTILLKEAHLNRSSGVLGHQMTPVVACIENQLIEYSKELYFKKWIPSCMTSYVGSVRIIKYLQLSTLHERQFVRFWLRWITRNARRHCVVKHNAQKYENSVKFNVH